MAGSYLDFLRFFFNFGEQPQIALAAGLAAQQRGKEAAAKLASDLVAKLTHIATGAKEWAEHRAILQAKMAAAVDSFGLGETEAQLVTRLETIYTQTIVTDFNGSLYSRMFSASSKERYPFYQFWSEYNDAVCTKCRPLDAAIIDKADPYAGYLLPQLHIGCRCTVKEVTRDEAIAQPQFLVPSCYRYLMNVDADFRFDKSSEGWERMEVA